MAAVPDCKIAACDGQINKVLLVYSLPLVAIPSFAEGMRGHGVPDVR